MSAGHLFCMKQKDISMCFAPKKRNSVNKNTNILLTEECFSDKMRIHPVTGESVKKGDII